MMKITSNNSTVRAAARGTAPLAVAMRARMTTVVRSALVLGLSAAALGAVGCETTRTRTVDSRYASGPRDAVIGLNGGRQGGASDVVFSSPRVQRYYIAISPETMAELTRRDADLAIYDPAPISAIENEWPVAARPDISRERTGRTSTFNDRRFIYYELERD